jgi:hypothetical protein
MEQEIPPVSFGKLPVCAEYRAGESAEERYCARGQDATQKLPRVGQIVVAKPTTGAFRRYTDRVIDLEARGTRFVTS